MKKFRLFSTVVRGPHKNYQKFADPKLQEIYDKMTKQAEEDVVRLNKEGVKPIKIDPDKLDESYDKAEKSYKKFSAYG